MLYPAFLVVLLGSQVINVMNAQRNVETMEHRYQLKMHKLDELTLRVRRGERVNVSEEMKLVDKVFGNTPRAKFSVMGQRVASSTSLASSPTTQSSSTKDDGLGELTSLIEEVMRDDYKPKPMTVKPKTQKEEIKIDLDEIHHHMKREKELSDYKLNPQQHLIVESPGDYVESAKDTQVKKFL